MHCMHLISICVLVLVVDMEQLHNHLLLCYIRRLFLTNAVTSQPGQGAYTVYSNTVHYQTLTLTPDRVCAPNSNIKLILLLSM